jgi:hypothetical protein
MTPNTDTNTLPVWNGMPAALPAMPNRINGVKTDITGLLYFKPTQPAFCGMVMDVYVSYDMDDITTGYRWPGF